MCKQNFDVTYFCGPYAHLAYVHAVLKLFGRYFCIIMQKPAKLCRVICIIYFILLFLILRCSCICFLSLSSHLIQTMLVDLLWKCFFLVVIVISAAFLLEE